MAPTTLSILKPDFEELDVWGKKDEPGFLRKAPAG
jgi:hypothetical protein